jgi:hypothetical protein
MGPLATVDFLWGDEDEFDLHLLRGDSSADLLDGLFVSDGSPNFIPAAGPGLPADFLGVSFACDVLPAKLVQQGITIDAKGRINLTASSPPAPILRNFLVHARATHTNPALPSPLEVDIRVHVHESVMQIWLTPTALTVHVGADGLKFTVLAEFDDGVVGDITAWTNPSWSSTASEGRQSPMGVLGMAVFSSGRTSGTGRRWRWRGCRRCGGSGCPEGGIASWLRGSRRQCRRCPARCRWASSARRGPRGWIAG